MVTMMNKELSRDKRATYIGISLGCMRIADNFIRLSKLYSNAIAENKELNGKYQFKGLPPVYALIQQLGTLLYENLVNAGISIKEENNNVIEIDLY